MFATDILLQESSRAPANTSYNIFTMAASQIIADIQVGSPYKRTAAARPSSPDTPAQLEREPHAHSRHSESASTASRARHALQFGQRPPVSDAAELTQPMFLSNAASAATDSRDVMEKSACMQQRDGTARVAGGVSSREREEEPLLQDNEDRFCMYPIR